MQNKVVLITGASSGIGKALAYELASQGAKLALAARNIAALEEIKQELISLHQVDVIVVKTDVTQMTDCQEFVQQSVAHFGRIDVLVNNAGISMRALFEDLDLDVIKQLMDVNFWGTVYCTKYALPWLLESRGSVVGVISVAGFVALPARSGYVASKFAVRGFLNTLRVETMKKGLHVLVVAPGFTSSNIRRAALSSQGKAQGTSPRLEDRMMSAETCARIMIKSIRKRKREVVMTFMEGKLSVFLSKWLPGWVDKLAYRHMAKEPESPFN